MPPPNEYEGAPPPVANDLNTPSSFNVMNFNGQGFMGGDHLETGLYDSMATMHDYELSAGVISDTGTMQKKITASGDGIAIRGLQVGPHAYSYHSLWSFCPIHRTGRGAGVSIIWDSRIPFSNPYCDKSGRLAAITLHGPGKRALRLIGIYVYATPQADPAAALLLKNQLNDLILAAKAADIRYLVTGDFNEVPVWSDASVPGYHPSPYPIEYSICRLLKEHRQADMFRKLYPNSYGATRVDPVSGARTRLDHFWGPKAWARSGRSHMTVDSKRRVLCASDHCLSILRCSFKLALGGSHSAVRCVDSGPKQLRLCMSKLPPPQAEACV